jgi:hypothetical protein
MRKCTNIFTIYEEVVKSYITLHPIPLNFLKYEENLIFFFYQCRNSKVHAQRVLIDLAGSELVQHFAYRGHSHWRKGAARHVIDMVWLYRSPIPVGRRRVFLTILLISPCLIFTRFSCRFCSSPAPFPPSSVSISSIGDTLED